MPPTRKTFKAFCLLQGIVLLSISYMFWNIHHHTHDKTMRYVFNESGDNKTKYLLDSSKCRVPWFDPYDKIISKYFRNDFISCEPLYPILAYQDGTVIRLYHDVLAKHYTHFRGCVYVPVVRPNLSDVGYRLPEDRAIEFKNDTDVRDEFVRVTCSNGTAIVYRDYFAFILPKNTASARKHDKKRDKFNVLLLGLESISHDSFTRSLPKLRAYLKNLDAVELRVHSIVGKNTFPNMLGLFLGKSQNDLVDLGWNASQSFDRFDFLWKRFERAGYTTIWAEDGAFGGSFNYQRDGFKNIPTDYYYRPFTWAYSSDKKARPNSHCIGNRSEVSVLLKYMSDFIKMYKDQPFFSFAIVCRNLHHHARYVNMLEDPILSFFKTVQSLIWNNTVVVIFGDHGQRMSGIGKSENGRLEAKLPALYILLPSKLKRKYPKLMENLKKNANKLTSHFDIHSTLLHLLYMSDSGKYTGNKNARGLSLFNEIPNERSCDDAGISLSFCPCGETKKLDRSSVSIQTAANFSVTFLNNELKTVRNVCHDLSLVKVNAAYNLTLHDMNTTMYLIQITTQPGDATFDFIVEHTTGGEFSISEKPLRINLYGNQSFCVADIYLKTICYCSEVNKQTEIYKST